MAAPPHSRILLRLRELAQLFNSMDPSPFVERDLDADAEEFITSWARELPGRDPLELVLHLASAPAPDRAAGVEEAVRHYFATRAEIKRREFGFLLRRGRTSLIVGLVFLAACLTLGGFVARHSEAPVSAILREGLVIAGWVAMWRPLEIYLYDWWPIWDDRRIFSRLARMKVRIEYPKTGDTPATAVPAPRDIPAPAALPAPSGRAVHAPASILGRLGPRSAARRKPGRQIRGGAFPGSAVR